MFVGRIGGFGRAVLTGEEEEETLRHVRGKLFVLEQGQWKERGTGTMRLNVRRADGGGARLGAFALRAFFSSRTYDADSPVLLVCACVCACVVHVCVRVCSCARGWCTQ